MQKDSKIILIITSVIAAGAMCVLLFLGIHYLFGNPAGWIFPADLKTFTVVTGGDYSASDIADYLRKMQSSDQTYLRINDRLYCAVGDETYAEVDDLMKSLGWEFIGYDGNMQSVRYYYQDGKACYVRVEYDINRVWSLWNLGSPFEYDLAKQGYKNGYNG